MGILDRILRAGEGKKLKALQGMVPDINALEPEMERLSDEALQAKTPEFRQRIANGEDLDDLAIEAFAVVREAAKPMEAIDSIKIVQVDGLTGTAGGGASDVPAGDGNLASSAVAAALRYRAQAPIVDGLMKELGFDGATLDNLVAGATAKPAEPPVVTAEPIEDKS